MRQSSMTLAVNQEVAAGTCEMVLQGPDTEDDRKVLAQIRPGQFINLKLDGLYLRRPISICDWNEEERTITIIYKVVGRGTEQMARMAAGETLNVLWPLGNGYDLTKENMPEEPLLIGGGAGVPPMYGLCRRLIGEGAMPSVILGFRSAEDAFYEEKFTALGARVFITTEDGSIGQQGFVTDAMKDIECDRFYACGPEVMLRAIDRAAEKDIPGSMSFEERMGCGFGACMGCSCETKYGSKRICKDGPVLERSEIIW